MADDTLHLEHDGETIWFCREACKTEYAPRAWSGAPAPPPRRPAPRDGGRPDLRHDGARDRRTRRTLEHDGETVYFCCDGCKTKYQQEHLDAVAAG